MDDIDLKRKRVRKIFRDILSGFSEFKVTTSASKRPKTGDYPCVLIRTPESKEKFMGGPPAVYECRVLVIISLLYGGSSEPEDKMDDLASVIHKAVRSGLTGSDELSDLRRIQTRSESKEGGSELSGKTDLWYEVTYFVRDFELATNLQNYRGTRMDIGVGSNG